MLEFCINNGNLIRDSWIEIISFLSFLNESGIYLGNDNFKTNELFSREKKENLILSKFNVDFAETITSAIRSLINNSLNLDCESLLIFTQDFCQIAKFYFLNFQN